MTDQWFNSGSPAFSSDGKYLFLVSARDFNPTNGQTEFNHIYQDMARIYSGQLELPEAIAQGAQMLALAGERLSALLCFEREPAHCHRSLLLDAVAADAEVVHLFA